MRLRLKILRAFLLALSAVGLMSGVTGCESPKYDISGKVTYNGAPLDKPEGHIVFFGPKGEQVDSAIAPDGSYKALQVASGLNKVAIYYTNPKLHGVKSEPKMKPGETRKPVLPYITPENYANPTTSGLTLNVEKPDSKDFDFTGPKIP
jgi:hypothetical protein